MNRNLGTQVSILRPPPHQNESNSDLEEIRQTMNAYLAMTNMRNNFPNLLPVKISFIFLFEINEKDKQSK